MSTAEATPPGLETCNDVFQFAHLSTLNQQREEPKSWLVQIYPAASIGRFVHLTGDRITLGRDDSCNMMFDDGAVSRQHARIDRVGDRYVITDLKSRNGTFVNDQAVPSQTLSDGDRVRVGHQILKFFAADRFEEQYYERIYKMMTTDGLTEAYNRRYLIDILDRDVARSHRTGHPLSVMMIDLDGFKRVNDTYGHPVGDDLLHHLCQRVRTVLRADELLARYGGEEFTVLLANSDEAGSLMAAERVRTTVAKAPFQVGELEIPLTVSIGLATSRGNATATEMLTAADRNLYLAKQRGRNRVVA
ncbi:MAG TPA: GGDEF domain-containing protein [Pirellulales bacterium]|jgi:diguanylate cyclase (GGDEF)-like protein|nr:GGDEF domain-containing protein [Pirellulales bacterium]